MSHVEYPELSAEAKSAVQAGLCALGSPKESVYLEALDDRRELAAFLREAMKQASRRPLDRGLSTWQALAAIADNLHSPPPPPPTLAEAREAARQLAGPSAEVVHAFLFSLLEEGKT
jgi:hypothetical protein